MVSVFHSQTAEIYFQTGTFSISHDSPLIFNFSLLNVITDL